MSKTKDSIESKYKINPGHISRINAFKQFVGEETFNQILQGVQSIDIPLEEEKFGDLMKICLDDESIDYSTITYAEAEEIVSFFCRPFAARSLRQVKSTIAGISSLLQDADPKALRMAMESLQSRNQNGTSTDASSLQTETLSRESDSLTQAHPQDLQS